MLNLPSDDQHALLIQIPLVVGPRSTPTQPAGIRRARLQTPLADSFIAYQDATLRREFLHLAKTQREAVV